MSEKKIFFVVRILSVIGILLAVFLLWEQMYLPDFQPCRINSVVNCDAIITGEVAKTFGVPTPLYGLIGYVIILYMSFIRNKKLLMGMAAFGLVFCLWIGYRELFDLKVICPVCIACQLIMIVIFGLSIRLNKK